MQDDHLGDELTMAAIPLQGELDVGPRGVAVVGRIDALVVSMLGHRRAMQELEEPDRNITMYRRDPARAYLKLGVEPVAALMGMIVPGPCMMLEPLPLVPTRQIAAVNSIDCALVEMCPVEVLPEL